MLDELKDRDKIVILSFLYFLRRMVNRCKKKVEGRIRIPLISKESKSYLEV